MLRHFSSSLRRSSRSYQPLLLQWLLWLLLEMPQTVIKSGAAAE